MLEVPVYKRSYGTVRTCLYVSLLQLLDASRSLAKASLLRVFCELENLASHRTPALPTNLPCVTAQPAPICAGFVSAPNSSCTRAACVQGSRIRICGGPHCVDVYMNGFGGFA